MAVDPRLVTIAPHESQRVIPHRFDIGELEVAAFDESDGTFVTLAVRTGTEAAQQLMRVSTAVPVSPINLQYARSAGRAHLGWLRHVGQEMRPSHRPDAAAVRSRTPTVAWCASSCASASWISWRSRSGHGFSGSSVVA